jgi:hypothetical protein
MQRAQLIAYHFGQLRLCFHGQVQESNHDRFARQASHDAGFAEPMAVQEAGYFGGRILVQRLRETQLFNHHKAPKSAAQSGEMERTAAAIDAHSEFGKGERHFLNRSQKSGVRRQNRNSKTAQQVIPA